MIRATELVKTWRTGNREVRALDGLDLEVTPGEFLCLHGPSGSGKTTLLLALGGMQRPTSGTVTVGGDDVYGLSPADRCRLRAERIGFVFQLFHLVPYLSVVENVLLGASAATPVEDADSLLERLGLSGRGHHRPAELSAGERQRVAIGRALIKRPSLLLADEPTGNLDPAHATAVLDHLKAFHDEGGTVVLVSHSRGADRLADRVVSLSAGRLMEAVS
ncbi:MAG: ABC transporter ATP-binding protein [Planctomycetes bacterium]|nr:ABC transporter ATP-binding protein [Planctomycetota bacterium]